MAFLQLNRKSAEQQQGELIAAIYHHSQGGALLDFKQQCFALLAQHYPLIDGYWLIHQQGQPLEQLNMDEILFSGKELPETINNFIQLLNELPVVKRCQCFNMSQPILGQTTFMTRSLQLHDSQHRFVVSIKANALNEAQINELNEVFSHLAEAYRLNVLSQLRLVLHKDAAYALCKQDGKYMERSKAFEKMVSSTVSDKFPYSLKDRLQKHQQLFFKVDKVLDIFYLQALVIPPGLNALTLKELEVCLLVSQAQSNQQIAQAMQISRKTVENHLRSIYLKHPVSRAELFVLLQKTQKQA